MKNKKNKKSILPLSALQSASNDRYFNTQEINKKKR